MNDEMTAPKSQYALDLFAMVGERGLTWRELSAGTGGHHGQISAMLSTMHRRGTIARLTEKRRNCGVYVLPEHVAGRDTVPFGTRTNSPQAVPYKTLEAELHVELATLRSLVAAQQAELASRQAETEVYSEWVVSLQQSAAEAKKSAAKDARALRKERDAAVEEAKQQGEATGWNAGYDEGLSAGRREGVGKRKAEALLLEGRLLGRREEQDVVDTHAARMIEVIKQAVPIRTHHSSCYTQHPECALKAVRRGIAIRRQAAA